MKAPLCSAVLPTLIAATPQEGFELVIMLRNLCISRQRMCLHMRAGCGSIPAYAAI